MTTDVLNGPATTPSMNPDGEVDDGPATEGCDVADVLENFCRFETGKCAFELVELEGDLLRRCADDERGLDGEFSLCL